MSVIDKSSSTPLYIQLAKIIENDINNGLYLPGSKIPSEQDLIEMYNLSRITVRKAMQHLELKGLIIKKQGIGTFVNKQVFAQKVEDILELYPSLLSKGMSFEVKLLEYNVVVPNSVIQEILQIPGSKKVLKFTKKYLLSNSVPIIGQGFIPADIAKNWTERDVSEVNSLRLIREKAGIAIKNYKLKIKATSADDYLSNVLDIQEGEPILELQRIAFSTENKPVDYTKLFFRGESYEIVTEMFVNEENRLKVNKNSI